MILHPHEFPEESCINSDICIIGAGPAGISIALEFQDSNKKIALLAGGLEKETIINQDLNRGIINRPGSHEPLEENRRRAFGGASVIWGGRCIPFDQIDFEKRDWIPYSGWPVKYEELIPYYKKANKICKAGEFSFDMPQPYIASDKQGIIKGLDNDSIISSKLERWSTPVNFAKDYNAILNKSSNIRVLLDTHLVAIQTEESKEKVSSITAKAGQKKIIIKADTYILACGGIENPRLLLASKNKFYPNGIGNDHDVVGRYYMAHLTGIYAEISPIDRKNIAFDFERDHEGVYCRRRWWITEKAQREKKIGNAIFFLHQPENQYGHRDALFSTVFVTKFFISMFAEGSIRKAKNAWSKNKTVVFSHLSTILKYGWKQFPKMIVIAMKRSRKRRLPFVLPSVNSKTLGLYFQTEHVPNPESRITISEKEFDSLGIHRAVVDIRFTDTDRKTVMAAHRIFVDQYEQGKIGEIKFKPTELADFIENSINNFNSAAHHLGTTRMSADPHFGVVDSDCKVHGIDNLFISGSSVFPTGSHANPTLTLVALALRLADFLKTRFL